MSGNPSGMVSQYFTRDWNFIAPVITLPLLRIAASVIFIAPQVFAIAGSIPIPILSQVLIWIASVLFLGCVAIYHVRCPRFLKQYRHFSDFLTHGHSHRWIVWEFYHGLNKLPDERRERLVRETVFKSLALPYSDEIVSGGYEFPKTKQEKTSEAASPFQHGRDIFLPMWLSGEKYMIPMRETDEKRDFKIKELFWVMFTELAKSDPKGRGVIWALLNLAILFVVFAVIVNVWRAVSSLWFV